MSSKAETIYQNKLTYKLQTLFPDCLVVKNDPAQNQGVPDILILFGDRWAMLEVKLSSNAPHQPNQDYYIRKFDGWSFAAFIYPENEEKVLGDLQQAFTGAFREARVS